MDNLQIFSYNGIKPKYLFYSKRTLNTNKAITKNQVFGILKRTFNNQQNISLKFSSNLLNSSMISVGQPNS